MDSPGPCRVCGKPIPPTKAHRVTCGHPRCSRVMYARPLTLARPAAPPPRDMRDEPDTAGRRRIVDMMQRALDTGLSEASAWVVVASATDETVATVIAVWKSRGTA